MRVLYVLKHNPWAHGGGCYVSRCYLEAFFRIFEGVCMDICICEEYIDDIDTRLSDKITLYAVKERSWISKRLAFATGILHRHRNVVHHLLHKNVYDYCIFDHSFIAGNLVKESKKLGDKSITIHHNCETDYFRDNTPNAIIRTLLLPQIKKNEKTAYLNSNYNIFLTNADKQSFEERFGISEGKSMVIGCFERGNIPLPELPVKEVKTDFTIVITGSIGNVQNLDGINDFLYNYYPMIPANFKIIIAGQRPPVELKERCGKYDNITIIDTPSDMYAVLCRGDIFLCPARLGSGIKVRIMDGLRVGLPVIAHKNSGRGYEDFVKKEFMVLYDDKESFGNALKKIVIMLKNNEIDRSVVQQLYYDMFSLKTNVEKIKKGLFV